MYQPLYGNNLSNTIGFAPSNSIALYRFDCNLNKKSSNLSPFRTRSLKSKNMHNSKPFAPPNSPQYPMADNLTKLLRTSNDFSSSDQDNPPNFKYYYYPKKMNIFLLQPDYTLAD